MAELAGGTGCRVGRIAGFQDCRVRRIGLSAVNEARTEGRPRRTSAPRGALPARLRFWPPITAHRRRPPRTAHRGHPPRSSLTAPSPQLTHGTVPIVGVEIVPNRKEIWPNIGSGQKTRLRISHPGTWPPRSAIRLLPDLPDHENQCTVAPPTSPLRRSRPRGQISLASLTGVFPMRTGPRSRKRLEGEGICHLLRLRWIPRFRIASQRPPRTLLPGAVSHERCERS